MQVIEEILRIFIKKRNDFSCSQFTLNEDASIQVVSINVFCLID
jgi:hypothetical protein